MPMLQVSLFFLFVAIPAMAPSGVPDAQGIIVDRTLSLFEEFVLWMNLPALLVPGAAIYLLQLTEPDATTIMVFVAQPFVAALWYGVGRYLDSALPSRTVFSFGGIGARIVIVIASACLVFASFAVLRSRYHVMLGGVSIFFWVLLGLAFIIRVVRRTKAAL